MSGPWLVDNYTGLITSPLSGTMDVRQLALQENKRFFTNYDEAVKYSENIKAQNGNNSDFEFIKKAQITEVMLRGPWALVYLPYLILKPIILLFVRFIFPLCKAPFKKNARIENKITGWIVIIFLLGSIGYGSLFIYNKLIKTTGYVTTKLAINEYEKKENEPEGKEVGKIADDVVLKIENIKKTKDSTWLNVYKLDNNQPIKTWILLPEMVKITEENKYLIYNKNSRTWNNYYEQIDNKNKKILTDIQNEFKKSIPDIKIEHSTDKNKKETLKETAYIFPKKGFLELYKAGEEDFYYIDKNSKTEFLKQVKIAESKYENEKIEYFPSENNLKQKLLK